MTAPARGYPDLHAHLEALKAQGLLLTIDEPIDKDSELHALVRWQFVGGIEEAERKAFLFTNIVNAHGRKYAMPVVVGAIAANRAIYSIGTCAARALSANAAAAATLRRPPAKLVAMIQASTDITTRT